MKLSYPWKARLVVAIIMLALAFVGMSMTDIHVDAGWSYWKWMVLAYAVLALWLSWYLKRQQQTITFITLWHEVLHWGGLLCAILLVTHLVSVGTLSRFEAGLFQLILLGLTLFLAGVYIESTFIVIGVVLWLFAWFLGGLVEYGYFFVVPVIVVAFVVIVFIIFRSRNKININQNK